MYGQRARIGLIVPSSNTVCEPEMAALCPDGVATYATRILFEPTIEGLKIMTEHVERAAEVLSSESICALIAFCCTVGSMIGGPDHDREISCTNFRAIEVIQRLEDEIGKPVISSNQATMWYALRMLGIHEPLKGYGGLFALY